MKTAIIYSSRNKPGLNPHTGLPWVDATGAFVPEAHGFALANGRDNCEMLAVDCINNTTATRRRIVCEWLKKIHGIELLAIFCHGWSKGIQIGFTIPECDMLAKALFAADNRLKIALYCCWTADADGVADSEKVGPATDNGFADHLRDTLLSMDFKGGWVDGHKKEGHTSMNPYLIRFLIDPDKDVDGDNDIQGGAWIVQPGAAGWKKWSKALRGDMRYRFPLLSAEEIAAQVEMIA